MNVSRLLSTDRETEVPRQLHGVCFHGEQAIRSDLLSCGLLLTTDPDGSGLPAHLRHGPGTRPADQPAKAGWERGLGQCRPPTQPPHAH